MSPSNFTKPGAGDTASIYPSNHRFFRDASELQLSENGAEACRKLSDDKSDHFIYTAVAAVHKQTDSQKNLQKAVEKIPKYYLQNQDPLLSKDDQEHSKNFRVTLRESELHDRTEDQARQVGFLPFPFNSLTPYIEILGPKAKIPKHLTKPRATANTR